MYLYESVRNRQRFNVTQWMKFLFVNEDELIAFTNKKLDWQPLLWM